MPVRQVPGEATARVWQALQSSSCRDRQGGQQMGSWERQQQQAEERSNPVLQGTCSVLASCLSCSKRLLLAGHAFPGPFRERRRQGCCALKGRCSMGAQQQARLRGTRCTPGVGGPGPHIALCIAPAEANVRHFSSTGSTSGTACKHSLSHAASSPGCSCGLVCGLTHTRSSRPVREEAPHQCVQGLSIPTHPPALPQHKQPQQAQSLPACSRWPSRRARWRGPGLTWSPAPAAQTLQNHAPAGAPGTARWLPHSAGLHTPARVPSSTLHGRRFIWDPLTLLLVPTAPLYSSICVRHAQSWMQGLHSAPVS